MEIFFVYGLAVLFFLLLIPLVLFLLTHPVESPEATKMTEAAKAEKQRQRSSSSGGAPASNQERIASYGVLAAIFMFMFVMTFLTHKARA